MGTPPRVALIVEMSGIYGRQILDGVTRFMRCHRPWSVFLEQREYRAPVPPWLLRARWDGILCRSTDRRLARAFLKCRIPAVDLNDMYDNLGLPHVWSDHRAIGRTAAAHLQERGFRHFAFCGFTNELWSDLRYEGFRAAVGSCPMYKSPWRGSHAPEWPRDQEKIGRWLLDLPKPLGLMACNDVRGQQVLNACRTVGVYVPEQVAVVGVDNERFLCELCDPPLSSVAPDTQRIGYEAAELLDGMMTGSGISTADRLIEPVDVVVRQSSDFLGIEDPEVVAALRHIREKACSGLTVHDVAKHLSISRSVLERRLRKYIGHSPQREIRLVQLSRVKQLLAETNLSVEAVAKLAGFAHPEYMNVVFKRSTGHTPGEFRRHAGRVE